MATNRLKANICGTSYTLVFEDSLSYMRDLVAQVDAEMTELVQSGSRVSTTMAAVLTALNNADKACKESRAADELRLALKKMVDEREQLQNQLAAARAETARLTEENRQLRSSNAASAAPATKKATVTKKDTEEPFVIKTAHADRKAAPVTDFEEILDDDTDTEEF